MPSRGPGRSCAATPSIPARPEHAFPAEAHAQSADAAASRAPGHCWVVVEIVVGAALRAQLCVRSEQQPTFRLAHSVALTPLQKLGPSFSLILARFFLSIWIEIYQ